MWGLRRGQCRPSVASYMQEEVVVSNVCARATELSRTGVSGHGALQRVGSTTKMIQG